MQPVFTIGHSDRDPSEVIAMLRDAGVSRLADVRAFPMSRSNPGFNEAALAPLLAAHGIEYRHLAALGGRRRRDKSIPPQVNALWRNASFHNYADHALTPAFRTGLDALLDWGARRRCAVMCSEAVWWRCHRRIIADWLIAAGREVWHIMAQGRLTAATPTPGAAIGPDGSVTYPAPPASA